MAWMLDTSLHLEITCKNGAFFGSDINLVPEWQFESSQDNPIFYGTLNFSLSNLEFIHISIHLVVFSDILSRTQDLKIYFEHFARPSVLRLRLVLSDLESNPAKRNINQQAFEDHCPTSNYRSYR